MQPQIRRPMSGLQAGGLEPGEIHPSSVARLEAAQLQKMTQSGQSNLELRSPGKLSTGSNANQRSLYVVGLEREGGGGNRLKYVTGKISYYGLFESLFTLS